MLFLLAQVEKAQLWMDCSYVCLVNLMQLL